MCNPVRRFPSIGVHRRRAIGPLQRRMGRPTRRPPAATHGKHAVREVRAHHSSSRHPARKHCTKRRDGEKMSRPEKVGTWKLGDCYPIYAPDPAPKRQTKTPLQHHADYVSAQTARHPRLPLPRWTRRRGRGRGRGGANDASVPAVGWRSVTLTWQRTVRLRQTNEHRMHAGAAAQLRSSCPQDTGRASGPSAENRQ